MMDREIMSKNLSSRKNFRVECQKCKCKKVTLVMDRSMVRWKADQLMLKCKHCGKEQTIFEVFND